MIKIDQKRIRKTYYAGGVLILLAAFSLLSIPVFMDVQRDYKQKLAQLETSIIHQKEFYLKSVILEKISDIDLLRKRLESMNPPLADTELNARFREEVAESIYSTNLPDDGYIWINEIIDFSGGDQYAIRFVHPNLPETEGEYLSTKTEDIKGNLPYLEELQGIKTSGEVFHNYYFKKMNSLPLGNFYRSLPG